MDAESQFAPQGASSQAAKWSLLLAEASRALCRKVTENIDTDNPPDLVEFLNDQLQQASAGPNSLGMYFLTHGLLERAVCDPRLSNTEQAVSLAQAALVLDPHFDSKLLMFVGGGDARPHQVNRALILLNRLRANKAYLVMPALKLLSHPDSIIRANAAGIIGRAATNLGLIENVLQNSDPRVISTMLESLADRTDLDDPRVRDLLHMAAAHDHPRVSTIADALLSRLGDAEAEARISAMLHSENTQARSSANWAVSAAGAEVRE